MLKIYKNPCKKDDKRLKYINPSMPKPPFRLIVVGPTGSGKSNMIWNLLFNKKLGYTKYFHEIYCFIGSISDFEGLEIMIKENKRKNINLYNQFDDDQVKSLFDDIENDEKKPNVLMIFDDMITNGICKRNSTTILDTVFIRGRHCNMSIIISSQKYMFLNNNIRALNLSQLVIFYGTNRIDLQNICREHSNMISEEDLMEIIKTQLNKKYKFMIIDYSKDPENRFLDHHFEPINISKYLIGGTKSKNDETSTKSKNDEDGDPKNDNPEDDDSEK